MKISFNWLRQLVALPAEIGPAEVARRLSLSGLAVDAVTPASPGLSGAVVAEVRGRRPHPHANKLTLVDVFDGQEVTQVVCGAPNVPEPGEPGRSPLVVWARPGATLPSGITLSTREVRGIPSPGMLCAEDELGLSEAPEAHAGILILSAEDGVKVGSDFAAAAGLPDVVFDLDVTANRPDLLGHVGVAREVAAIFRDAGARLTLPAGDLSAHWGTAAARDLAAVEVRDPQGCPRYTARIITGLRLGKSPLHVRLRLQRLGVRALSNVVDATNLAMLEWGQPLHAFDLSHLRGRRIVVRLAGPGETMTTLDGVKRELQPDDVVIADAERAVALAGVMGGRDSEVVPETRDVLLESAYFDPASVRRTARRVKLHTEASHRFERGVDPNEGLVRASDRCAQLLAELAGGKVAPELIDVYPQPIAPLVLSLRPARTRALLGSEVSAGEQAELLGALGLVAGAGPEGRIQVTVPTFRPDLQREVDLIEEVGRLRGYEGIEPRLPPLRAGQERATVAGPSAMADRARDVCCALGLDEILTFSFVSPELLKGLGFPPEDRRSAPLVLHNPLREELSAMRTQVVVGLLSALRHNLSHGQTDVRLFEVGEVFLPRQASGPGLPEERTRVAGVLCGNREHWLKPRPGDELDFFDLRGVVDGLFYGLFGGPGAMQVRPARPGEVPWLHPGVAAVITDQAGAPVGELGEVHPDLRRRLGIEARAFAFEVDLPAAPPALPHFVPLPRFPEVTRDLSFFADEGLPAGQLLALLLGAGEPLLTDVQVMEDYREAGKVPAGKKGMLLSLTYRSPDRTLTDDEVRKAHEAVVGHLQRQVAVQLR